MAQERWRAPPAACPTEGAASDRQGPSQTLARCDVWRLRHRGQLLNPAAGVDRQMQPSDIHTAHTSHLSRGGAPWKHCHLPRTLGSARPWEGTLHAAPPASNLAAGPSRGLWARARAARFSLGSAPPSQQPERTPRGASRRRPRCYAPISMASWSIAASPKPNPPYPAGAGGAASRPPCAGWPGAAGAANASDVACGAGAVPAVGAASTASNSAGKRVTRGLSARMLRTSLSAPQRFLSLLRKGSRASCKRCKRPEPTSGQQGSGSRHRGGQDRHAAVSALLRGAVRRMPGAASAKLWRTDRCAASPAAFLGAARLHTRCSRSSLRG